MVLGGVMGTPISSHVAMVQEGGAGNRYLLRMGKRVGPAPVTQKCRHEFNIAFLNRLLLAGKVERHGWIECKRQAD
jgi:hypothetical protein